MLGTLWAIVSFPFRALVHVAQFLWGVAADIVAVARMSPDDVALQSLLALPLREDAVWLVRAERDDDDHHHDGDHDGDAPAALHRTVVVDQTPGAPSVIVGFHVLDKHARAQAHDEGEVELWGAKGAVLDTCLQPGLSGKGVSDLSARLEGATQLQPGPNAHRPAVVLLENTWLVQELSEWLAQAGIDCDVAPRSMLAREEEFEKQARQAEQHDDTNREEGEGEDGEEGIAGVEEDKEEDFAKALKAMFGGGGVDKDQLKILLTAMKAAGAARKEQRAREAARHDPDGEGEEVEPKKDR